MNVGKVARDNAHRVARLLRVRKGSDPLRRHVLRRFQEVLHACCQRPTEPARPHLIKQYQATSPRPQLQASLAVLELAWMVPTGSQVEYDIAGLVQVWHAQCTPWERGIIGDHVRDAAWSPFPVVRRLAHMVRESDPVDAREVEVLLHLIPSYPDLRISTCVRVLKHSQVEHLDTVLEYIVGIARRRERNREEHKQLAMIFAEMRHLSLGDADLVKVFQQYVEHFDDSALRGHLMRVLTAYADRLAPQIPPLVQARRDYFRPSVRLLQQMIEFSHPKAVGALGEIVRNSRGKALRTVQEALINAAQSLALQFGQHGGLFEMRGRFEALCSRLDESTAHTSLSARLRSVEWGEAAIESIVAKVLNNTANQAERKRVRGGGRRALDCLARSAADTTRPAGERIVAVTFLGEFVNTPFETIASEAVWRIYETEEALALSRAALHVLARLGTAPEVARERLAQDHAAAIENDDSDLGRVISNVWERLFPNSLPSERDPDADDLSE